MTVGLASYLLEIKNLYINITPFFIFKIVFISRARWPKSRDFGSAVAGGEPWLFWIFCLLFHPRLPENIFGGQELEKVNARPAGGQKTNMENRVSQIT